MLFVGFICVSYVVVAPATLFAVFPAAVLSHTLTLGVNNQHAHKGWVIGCMYQGSSGRLRSLKILEVYQGDFKVLKVFHILTAQFRNKWHYNSLIKNFSLIFFSC